MSTCQSCQDIYVKDAMSKKTAYKGWCQMCADSDEGFSDWADACLTESLKPVSEQRVEVFNGQTVSFIN